MSDDVADAVANAALGAPVKGTIEIAGPERVPLDEIIRRFLHAKQDPRKVIADTHARYFGAELDDRSLTPGDNAHIGSIRFEDWLRRSTVQQLGPPPSGRLCAPGRSKLQGTTTMSIAQQKTNISFDNTSRPGKPGRDELVPSRYALRVGDIDVMVVSDGVLSLPGAMLGHNADPAVRAAWLEDMFLQPDVLEWALNGVVVRSGGRIILIDAGMGAEFPDLPRAGRLVQRLEAAGIDLASVTDVVLTHMHMDHVGGLLVDGVRDRLRPDLRVHLAAAEAKFRPPDLRRV
jgi:Metallo-beta-lactamase superfamily